MIMDYCGRSDMVLYCDALYRNKNILFRRLTRREAIFQQECFVDSPQPTALPLVLPCLFFKKHAKKGYDTLSTFPFLPYPPFSFPRYPPSAVCASFMLHCWLLSCSKLRFLVCSLLMPFFPQFFSHILRNLHFASCL